MRVSYKWLMQYVDLEGISPEEVADKLTFAGAEVEGIETLASGTNLVIGKIISCIPHPDSDHLHVLQVDEGQFGVEQIVCGAPNAREGLKVIVSRPGAKLPGGEISKSKIRGVESNGMCCSLLELGVDKKYLSEKQVAGIEELPEEAPIGETDVLGYLGLDDKVLEVSVLPNRPDLNAMENVAREVACLFHRDVKIPSIKEEKAEKSSFKVGSLTPKCPQFSGKVYRGVKNGPSPKWLKDILIAEGIRSIDTIVDIGNYVMLLTGQPLNMYDADKLEKEELVVIDDYEGEFLAMDGNTYKLEKGDLLVTSNRKPVCLAGIMTADAARIDENTKNIVVEAANFDYASIRRTSNRLGLASDSSNRFCKGINPHQAEYVQEVTKALLVSLCKAEKVYETVNYDTIDHAKKLVEVSVNYINSRLGTSFSKQEIVNVLKEDHFLVKEDKGEALVLEVPPYRIDIEGKADISEEVIRLLGYENVHSILPTSELACKGLTESQTKKRMIRRYLLSSGVSEVLTYTLIAEKDVKTFDYITKKEAYRLSNPLTVDREYVRTNLMPSLLSVLSYNVNHQNKDVAIFEISDIDAKDYTSRHLAIALTGKAYQMGEIGGRPYDFYDVKGYLEGILTLLGLNSNRVQIVPWTLGGEELHPGRSAEIRTGKKLLGYLGELHPLALKDFGLDNAVILELDLGELLNMKVSEIKYKPASRFPAVTRDLALLLDEKVTFEEIRVESLRADSLIHKVFVFDLYRGKGVPEGKKSLAITLTLYAEDHTLKDEEIALSVKKAIDALSRKFLAEIRS